MKKLVCVGCGATEDLNEPTGNIHTVKFIDLHPQYDSNGGPDKPIEEDLCKRCRNRVRREFLGEADDTLLDMPLMLRESV